MPLVRDVLRVVEHEFVSWPQKLDAEPSTVRDAWIAGEIAGKIVEWAAGNLAGEELPKSKSPGARAIIMRPIIFRD
jgi:hypothetical protein